MIFINERQSAEQVELCGWLNVTGMCTLHAAIQCSLVVCLWSNSDAWSVALQLGHLHITQIKKQMLDAPCSGEHLSHRYGHAAVFGSR